jgi:hypothetical protein
VTPDRPHHEERLAQLFHELDSKEQREPPPDAIMNSPIVDAIAWRGPFHATRLPRAAILLWAFGYIGTGISFLSVALKLLVGIRITVNAFARSQANETNGQKNRQKSR